MRCDFSNFAHSRSAHTRTEDDTLRQDRTRQDRVGDTTTEIHGSKSTRATHLSGVPGGVVHGVGTRRHAALSVGRRLRMRERGGGAERAAALLQPAAAPATRPAVPAAAARAIRQRVRPRPVTENRRKIQEVSDARVKTVKQNVQRNGNSVFLCATDNTNLIPPHPLENEALQHESGTEKETRPSSVVSTLFVVRRVGAGCASPRAAAAQLGGSESRPPNTKPAA